MKKLLVGLFLFTLLAVGTQVYASGENSICSETDGGNNPYIFGKVTLSNPTPGTIPTASDQCYSSVSNTYSDSCSGTGCQVMENYCIDFNNDNILDTYNTTYINCSNGCKNGACNLVEKVSSYCTDSDGGYNEYTKGTVNWLTSDAGLLTNNDTCTEETTKPTQITEYGCVDNKSYSKVFTCSYGCSNGACIPPTTKEGCNSSEGYSSTTGKKCPGNNAPVISGVSGPQSLNIYQTGTWMVKASSSTVGNLSYSVVWGDEGYQLYAMASVQPITNTQQSATFTHSYSQAGTYTPTFTVTSENTIRCITTPCPSNGGSATTSLSVKVGSSSIYPAGCNSTEGYSYTTGLACDGSQGNGIDGCLPGQNYSSTTGQVCVRIDPPCSSSGVGCGLGNTSIRRTLRRGIKGDDVKMLQLFLNLSADGSFGPATQAKVMEWQAQNGLKVDGLFGVQSATTAGLAE